MSEREDELDAELERNLARLKAMKEFAHRDPAKHGLRIHRLIDEIIRLRAQLTTAERERDEARAAIGTLRELVGCRSRNVGDVDMPTHTREIMEAVRHRAERAERVVEAARQLRDHVEFCKQHGAFMGVTANTLSGILEAVRTIDATPTPEGDA